jgi:hypothetical protein
MTQSLSGYCGLVAGECIHLLWISAAHERAKSGDSPNVSHFFWGVSVMFWLVSHYVTMVMSDRVCPTLWI